MPIQFPQCLCLSNDLIFQNLLWNCTTIGAQLSLVTNIKPEIILRLLVPVVSKVPTLPHLLSKYAIFGRFFLIEPQLRQVNLLFEHTQHSQFKLRYFIFRLGTASFLLYLLHLFRLTIRQQLLFLDHEWSLLLHHWLARLFRFASGHGCWRIH